MASRLSRLVNPPTDRAREAGRFSSLEQIKNKSHRSLSMTWTAARIVKLERLWAEGVSAAGIADALGGVSRSAVLGKLHRLQLLGSRKPASAPRRYDGPSLAGTGADAQPSLRPAQAALARLSEAPSPPRSPWREEVFVPLLGTTPRPWLSREFGECAFPVAGDGDALISCCAAVKLRSVYCQAHHGVVFKPVSPAIQAVEQRRWSQAAERWAA